MASTPEKRYSDGAAVSERESLPPLAAFRACHAEVVAVWPSLNAYHPNNLLDVSATNLVFQRDDEDVRISQVSIVDPVDRLGDVAERLRELLIELDHLLHLVEVPPLLAGTVLEVDSKRTLE